MDVPLGVSPRHGVSWTGPSCGADCLGGLAGGEKPGHAEKLRQKFFPHSALCKDLNPQLFWQNRHLCTFYLLHSEHCYCEHFQDEEAAAASIFIKEILKKIHLFFRIITVNWKHLLQLSVCQKHPNLLGSLCRNTHSVLSG